MANALSTATPTTTRDRLPLAFLPLVLTYLAVALNMTVTSVALPTISVDLQVTSSDLIWIVNITPIAAAALILFAGSWGDRFGRRRLLLAGIIVFLVSATLSALATSPEQLIALRALTGVGSALTMPAALALTFDVVGEASQRTAIGVISSTQAVGSLLGPIVAGTLLLTFSWGSAFLSVTPLLLVSLVIVAWKVPADRVRPSDRPPMDTVGATLMAAAGTAFIYAAVSISSSRGSGVDGSVWSALVVGVVASVALVGWEIRCPHPIFVGSVLRSRSFWVPTLIIFTVQFALGGVMFLSTQYVQLALGFSAFAAGLFLVPALGMWIVSSATAGITARRWGIRRVVPLGLGMAALGLLLLSMSGLEPSYALDLLGLLLVGTMGLAPALTTHTAVSAYPEERRTVGSAINSAAVRFGLASGVAIMGSTLAITYARSLASATSGLTADQQQLADNSLGGALQVAASVGGPTGQALADAARTAFTAGFQTTMGISAVILGILAVIAAVWLPPATRGETVDDTEMLAAHVWDGALREIPEQADWVAAQLDGQLETPGLNNQGRHVMRAARPRLLGPDSCAADQAVVTAVAAALDAAAELVLTDPDRRRTCLGPMADDAHLMDLFALPPGYPQRIAFGRFDGVRSHGGLNIIEFNGGLPGGIAPTMATAAEMRSWPPFAALEDEFEVSVPNLRDEMIDALVGVWQSFGGSGTPRVAFVVPTEFQAYVANSLVTLIAAMGERDLAVTTCDPGALVRRDGAVHGPDGRVDVAVRVFFTSMATALGDRLTTMVEAVRDGELCMVTSFRQSLMGHKSLFALVTDPAVTLDLAPADLGLARAHLPWTRLWADGPTTDPSGLAIDLREYALAARERLVLKPADGTGGAGVLLGWEQGDQAWQDSLAQTAADGQVWILQDRVPLTTEDLPVIEEGFPLRTFQVDHNPLVFNDRVGGYFVRVSETGGITNMSTGDGTVLPTYVVSPRD